VVIVDGNDFEQFQSVENAYTVFFLAKVEAEARITFIRWQNELLAVVRVHEIWGLRLFCEPTLTIPDLAANFEISNL
jgi:hypothetical protein